MSDLQQFAPEPEDGGTPRRLDFTLRLNTLRGVRQSMARVIREYGKGNVPDHVFRGAVWALSQLTGTFKVELEYEQIERRLAELERRLQE